MKSPLIPEKVIGDWRQAIIWTNAGILLIGPLGSNFIEIFNRNSNIFIQESAFQGVVCETAAILSRPECVKTNTSRHDVQATMESKWH